MGNDWFRSWHGAPTDNKWLLIGRKAGVAPGIVSAIWYALTDYASQNEDRGAVAGFDIETHSVFSGFEEEQIKSVIGALKEKEIIVQERLVSWEKRQPNREDGSTERVRRYREKKKKGNDKEPNVTQCNTEKRKVTTDSDSDKDSPLCVYPNVQLLPEPACDNDTSFPF